MASNRLCFMLTWTIFKKSSLGGRPNIKPGDHGAPIVSQLLVYSKLSCVRTRMNRNSLK